MTLIKIIATLIAVAAAYSGGLGIVHLLGADMLFVAVVIEAAKIGINVTISAYWKQLTWALRLGGVVLLVIGMAFSMFGTYSLFLEKFSTMGDGQAAAQVEVQTIQDQIQADKDALAQMDKQIEKTPGYDKLDAIKAQKADRARIGADLASLQTKLGQAKTVSIKTEGSSLDKTAQAWGTNPQVIARYIMLALTLLFDPAAFWLVSAASMIGEKKTVETPVESPKIEVKTVSDKKPSKKTHKLAKVEFPGDRNPREQGVPALGRGLKEIMGDIVVAR